MRVPAHQVKKGMAIGGHKVTETWMQSKRVFVALSDGETLMVRQDQVLDVAS